MMFSGISDGVLVAALGAVFNAGAVWATVKFLTWRLAKVEQSADRAHKRIDELAGFSHRRHGDQTP